MKLNRSEALNASLLVVVLNMIIPLTNTAKIHKLNNFSNEIDIPFLTNKEFDNNQDFYIAAKSFILIFFSEISNLNIFKHKFNQHQNSIKVLVFSIFILDTLIFMMFSLIFNKLSILDKSNNFIVILAAIAWLLLSSYYLHLSLIQYNSDKLGKENYILHMSNVPKVVSDSKEINIDFKHFTTLVYQSLSSALFILWIVLNLIHYDSQSSLILGFILAKICSGVIYILYGLFNMNDAKLHILYFMTCIMFFSLATEKLIGININVSF